MARSVKLPYSTTPEALGVIAQWRQLESVVIRLAYNRVRDGWEDKPLLDFLREIPKGRFDSWLTLSALKKGQGAA